MILCEFEFYIGPLTIGLIIAIVRLEVMLSVFSRLHFVIMVTGLELSDWSEYCLFVCLVPDNLSIYLKNKNLFDKYTKLHCFVLPFEEIKLN